MLDYLAAIFSHWVAVMSGIVSVLGGIALRTYNRFSKKRRRLSDIPNLAFIFVGLCCLGYASFCAWSDEHARATKAEGELLDRVPRPVCSIDELTFGGMEKSHTSIDVVTAIVKLVNQGQDSVFDQWEASIQPPGQSASHAVQLTFPGGINMFMPRGGSSLFKDADALDRKTFPDAVRRGEARRGWLSFKLDTPIKLSTPVGVHLTVSFRDAFGNKHSCEEFVGRTNADNLVYLPGMSLSPCGTTHKDCLAK